MSLQAWETELVERSLRISALCSTGTDDVRWFGERVDQAFAERCGLQTLLRVAHPRLSRPEVKALGFRSNTAISSEFFARLNEAGKRDPIEAAHVIASTLMTALGARRSLARSQSYGFDLRYRLVPSPMAAGPCARAAACSRQVHTPESAPDLPLEGCDRLGQCACLWRIER